jgi:hypothetical protein
MAKFILSYEELGSLLPTRFLADCMNLSDSGECWGILRIAAAIPLPPKRMQNHLSLTIIPFLETYSQRISNTNLVHSEGPRGV